MARKSAAELKQEAAALNDVIAQGRKKALNFALIMGKDGCALEAHPTKGADVMFRQAKAAAGGTRGTQGVMNVSGKVIEFTCESDDFPSSLPKAFKRHMKERGLAFKVAMILPGGETLTDGDDDDEDAAVGAPDDGAPDTVADDGEAAPDTAVPDTTAPDTTVPDTAARDELADRLRQLVPQVRAAAARGAPVAERLGKGLQAAAAELKAGNLERAQTLIAAVARALSDLTKAGPQGAGPTPGTGNGATPPETPATPEVNQEALRRKLQNEFTDLADKLRTLRTAASKEVAAKAGQVAALFQSLLDQGDLTKAANALKLLGQFVTSELAKLAETAGLPDEGPSHTNPEAMIAEHGQLSVKERAALLDLARTNPAGFAAAQGALEAMDRNGVVEISPEARRKALDTAETARKAHRVDLAALKKAQDDLAVFAGDVPVPGSPWETAHQAAGAALKAFRDFTAGLPDPASMTEKQRQDAMIEGQRLDRLAKEAQAAAQKAKAEMEAAARTAVDDATARVATSKAAADAARKDVEARDAKRALVDALAFGPLSPGGKPPLSDEDKNAFIAAFGNDGVMAQRALGLAVAAPDPSLIARNVGMVSGKVADGFADDSGRKLDLPAEQLRDMGLNALRMGSLQGEDYFKGFDAYLKSGKQHDPDPTGGMAEPLADRKQEAARRKQVAVARTQTMGAAALDESGKVDFASPGAKAAMDHMLFHPGSLTVFTPNMNRKMAETKALFADPTKGPIAQRTIDKTSLPAPDKPGRKASLDIVARTMGKPEFTVTDNDAKGAVLAAMMTPLSQGPVGSCFSTAPVRAIRETDPLRAMDEYSKIARTGQFVAADGFAIPANRRVPQNENVLMRSWEYSVATATQERAQGRKRRQLTTALMPGTDPAKGLDRIKDVVKGDWDGKKKFLPFQKPDEGVKLRLRKAIQQKMRFEYNAGLDATGGGGDGSSTNGVYQIFVGDVPLDSEAAFKRELATLALEAAKEKPDSERGKDIVDLVNSQPFIDEILAAYGPPPADPAARRAAPWNLGGGGLETEAAQVVNGGNPRYRDVMPRPDPTAPAVPMGARTKALLENIVTAQQGRPGDMALMGTTGTNANHAFNTLPNHPSVADLQPPDIGAKIDAKLIEPGRKIANTKLPAEQGAAIFEKTVRTIMEKVHPDDRETVMAALESLPTEALSPAEIKTAILDAVTETRTKKYVADREPGAAPDRVELIRQALKGRTEEWIGKNLSLALTEEMRPPEAVVADTNWGGAEDQVLFVVIPDATSGELGLYRKDAFTGKLTPAGDNWANAKWDTTHE